MQNQDIQQCCQTIAPSVNVLFADCPEEFVDCLRHRLLDKRLTWDTVSLCELEERLENCTIIGAVVFGKTVCSQTESEKLSSILKNLEKRCIAAFFLTCGPSEIKNCCLATVIDPQSEDELPARLETAAQFVRRHLDEQNTSGLHKDTIEQLEMAGQVQRNFLPSRLPHTDHIRWAAMFRPAQWVSGDIYDMTRLDETHIGFYLADAVGHSMPAALLTIFLKQATVMRQTMGHEYRIFEPEEVIVGLNQRMAQQEFSGCLFATCCYGLLNIETYQLRMARAGHPYPILIRNNQPQCLQSRGGLLGVFNEARFEQITCQLQPGDKLFLYSDGGEPLIGKSKDDGTFAFSKNFLSIAELPVEAMIETFDDMARHHRFAPSEIDDVTAVALEILP